MTPAGPPSDAARRPPAAADHRSDAGGGHPAGAPRSGGPGPQASTGFWLRQAALAWQRELARRLRPLGLTPTQFFVLSCTGWLEVTEGPPTQQEVADVAGLDRMTTSKVVAVLEREELLSHRQDAHHARIKRLTQTPRGRELVLAALAHVRDIEQTWFAHAGPDLRTDLAGIAAHRPAADVPPDEV